MGDRTATIAAENISSLSDFAPSHPPTLASVAWATVDRPCEVELVGAGSAGLF